MPKRRRHPDVSSSGGHNVNSDRKPAENSSHKQRVDHWFGWKRLDVEKSEADDTTTDKQPPANHYDTPSLTKVAAEDLEAQPQEEGGIFLGLEVLDGDSYHMQEDESGLKMMIPVHGVQPTKPKKEKKRQSQSPSEEIQQPPLDEKAALPKEGTNPVLAEQGPKKRKRKKRKKKSKDKPNDQDGNSAQQSEKSKDNDAVQEKDDEQRQVVSSMQAAWSAQTGGLLIHPAMCASLVRQEFWCPTPIQAAVLPAAVLGRRNIVGAAPTGSGKTLAFLVPIGQFLLEQEETESKDLYVDEKGRLPLQALILTPTRELAQQIQAESDKLLGKGKTGSLVGGLAIAKQTRLLERNRPAIIVATPGRLWEMISSRQYPHLNNLSRIRFLVIDEADRMVQQNSFPELEKILDAVQRANPMDDEDGSDGEQQAPDDDDGVESDEDRLMGLPGVPGESKLVMLNDDVLAEIERQRAEGNEAAEEDKQPRSQRAGADNNACEEMEDNDSGNSEEQLSLPQLPPVERQTFVFSATLTLRTAGVTKKHGKKVTLTSKTDLDGVIAEILEKSRAKGKTKVVDLSNAASTEAHLDKNDRTQEKSERNEMSKVPKAKADFRLPDGLLLYQVKCTKRHKDLHLYAYLMTTAEGSSGPCLVFCNSIPCVKRVAATLELLGLDVRSLHAHMQQRARFKSIELLQGSKKKRTVVVATDVAARGLDIPSVASIVHYDAARTLDSFVHRSGRTARGVGPDAVGSSLSLVAPNEDKMHTHLVGSLGVKFQDLKMDGRLIQEALARVSLAAKVVEVENKERRTDRQNQWVKTRAAEAGLDLDDDLIDEGLAGGDKRDIHKLAEAKKARETLSVLLAQPMRTHRYGKFLSTNRAFNEPSSASESHIVEQGKSKRRRRK